LLQLEGLTVSEIEKYVSEIDCPPLADWFGSYVLKQNRERETVREAWMCASHQMTARLGWSLTAERIVKSPQGLDLPGLLTRLEQEMPSAPSSVQWTMNYCLAEIGIHFGDLRDRALAIGERIGAFRDYPTSKGCVSPFAPIWIAEMVSRNG
jgi:3-methyladenine DNA glycosylase AlkD